MPAATAMKKPEKSTVTMESCMAAANSEVTYALVPPTVASPDWIRTLPADIPQAIMARIRAQITKRGRRA